MVPRMKTVSAREANQAFSKLLGDVENGQEIVITKRGAPVAKLVPYAARPLTAERKKALEELMAIFEKGLPFGGRRFTRDEMHER